MPSSPPVFERPPMMADVRDERPRARSVTAPQRRSPTRCAIRKPGLTRLETTRRSGSDRLAATRDARTSGTSPQHERRRSMAELSTKKRNAEPKSAFGPSDWRKYPMPDKAHARNAKALASQQVKKGNLTAAEK